MDGGGILALAVSAIVLGVLFQYLGQYVGEKAHYRYQWVADGIGALFGGYAASELIGPAGSWGPEFGGLFLIPALVGGLVVGALVELVLRAWGPAPTARGRAA